MGTIICVISWLDLEFAPIAGNPRIPPGSVVDELETKTNRSERWMFLDNNSVSFDCCYQQTPRQSIPQRPINPDSLKNFSSLDSALGKIRRWEKIKIEAGREGGLREASNDGNSKSKVLSTSSSATPIFLARQ